MRLPCEKLFLFIFLTCIAYSLYLFQRSLYIPFRDPWNPLQSKHLPRKRWDPSIFLNLCIKLTIKMHLLIFYFGTEMKIIGVGSEKMVTLNFRTTFPNRFVIAVQSTVHSQQTDHSLEQQTQ